MSHLNTFIMFADYDQYVLSILMVCFAPHTWPAVDHMDLISSNDHNPCLITILHSIPTLLTQSSCSSNKRRSYYSMFKLQMPVDHWSRHCPSGQNIHFTTNDLFINTNSIDLPLNEGHGMAI